MPKNNLPQRPQSTRRNDNKKLRIAVVGATGSGKTTLAQTIARRLDLPHIETDAIFWGPNWTEPDRDAFRRKIEPMLRGERWVVDGNYGFLRDLVWGRADTLVWLDYPFRLCSGG